MGGEVYAFSATLEHMSMLREFRGHALGFRPGLVGLEDYESVFTRLESQKVVAEKFLVRHFLATQCSDSLGYLLNQRNWAV